MRYIRVTLVAIVKCSDDFDPDRRIVLADEKYLDLNSKALGNDEFAVEDYLPTDLMNFEELDEDDDDYPE